MASLRSETQRFPALTGALSLIVLVGALVGATLHDAEHAFDDGDIPCGVCLHADRVDGAATTAPPVRVTRSPDAIVDIRQAEGADFLRIAEDYRPRAPPFAG